MNRNFRNVWIELSIQQACNCQLVNQMTKSFETYWLLEPLSLIDRCLPQTDEPLNPLEFHGKRRSEWPPLPQAGKRMA